MPSRPPRSTRSPRRWSSWCCAVSSPTPSDPKGAPPMQPLEIPSHEKILARIEAIGPGLRALASACDEARQVLPESLKAMVDAGLFRTMMPRSVGGYEMNLRTFHQAVARVSEFCPSSGWVLMVMGGHHHVLGSFPAAAQQ